MLSAHSAFRDTLLKGDLPFVEKWEQVQNYYSRITGVNLSLFLPNHSFLIPPSEATPFCRDIIQSRSGSSLIPSTHCLLQAFDPLLEDQQNFLCPHGLYFGVARKQKENHPQYVLVLGPVLIHRRPSQEACQIFCEENQWDTDIFYEGLQEIRLFSHQRTRNVVELAQLFLDLLD